MATLITPDNVNTVFLDPSWPCHHPIVSDAGLSHMYLGAQLIRYDAHPTGRLCQLCEDAHDQASNWQGALAGNVDPALANDFWYMAFKVTDHLYNTYGCSTDGNKGRLKLYIRQDMAQQATENALFHLYTKTVELHVETQDLGAKLGEAESAVKGKKKNKATDKTIRGLKKKIDDLKLPDPEWYARQPVPSTGADEGSTTEHGSERTATAGGEHDAELWTTVDGAADAWGEMSEEQKMEYGGVE